MPTNSHNTDYDIQQYTTLASYMKLSQVGSIFSVEKKS